MENYKIKALWAKKKEEDGSFYWLPLLQHLKDTKNVTNFLWEHWLSEGQREIVNSSLELKDNEFLEGNELALLLALTHDIGKATPAFQTKKAFTNSRDLDLELLEKLESRGFKEIYSLSLPSANKSHHSIAGQYLLSQHGVKEDFATIVGAHHGKPVQSIKDVEEQAYYPTNYYQVEDKHSPLYQNWQTIQEELFTWALEEANFQSVDAIPSIKQPAQVILLGLLIMADWIASNEEYFPLLSLDEEEIFDQESRFVEGISKWRKTTNWEPEYLPDWDELYEKRFGFKPRNVQSVLTQVIADADEPGIVILEAPMGLGKTEAALVVAEQLANKSGRSGIFFGLPTQATSNGIFGRIEEWLTNIVDEMNEEGLSSNLSIHLVHGKAALNKEFTKLPRGNTVNFDDITNGSVIINDWFSGKKKTALDDFVVGTVDQFLMVSLKQKHLALRHLGFSKKVVIIDEVHAYDAYMSQYLLEAVEWMGAYRVPVIILSATLPSKQREALLKSYLHGMGVKWKTIKNKDTLDTDAYPLITYNDGCEIHQVKEFNEETSKTVHVQPLAEDNLLSTVKEAIEDGGVVGIIVNTVKRAQELGKIYEEVFGEEIVDLLHSNFISTERIKKEQKLLREIGKNAKRPFRKIIIGTQVIEQSLDIDFDVMISDLAPMDLLIQRIGRLHRHSITRPKKHEEAKLYVLGTNPNLEFEKGSSFVYGDYLLARTQGFLPSQIALPNDISPLVQKVYNFEEGLEFEKEELYQKYQVAKKEHNDKVESKKNKADIFKIGPPLLKTYKHRSNSLIGWLANTHPDDSEERAYAQVRDIEDTIEVIALKKVDEGYSLFTDNKELSQLIDNPSIARKIAQNTIRLPVSLSKSYNVDSTIRELEKYNLKYLASWQKTLWLKGSLGIVFDENNEFILNGYKLFYDEKYGIKTERIKQT
jgi:CRISPR-associated helicase cas3